jgi:hypothetical protein
LRKFLLVTNSGASGCTWHIYGEGEKKCFCKRHSHHQVGRNTSTKRVSGEELVQLLENNQTPGLGKWAGKCQRKALEELTGEKQFSCKVCGQPVSNRSGLISHIHGTHGKTMEAAKEMASEAAT